MFSAGRCHAMTDQGFGTYLKKQSVNFYFSV